MNGLVKGAKIEIGFTHRATGREYTYRGTLISAHNWGMPNTPTDWYIEMTENFMGYCYLKEQVDGLDNFTVKVV